MYSYIRIRLFVYLDHRSSSISMVLIPIIEKHLVTALNSHQKGGGRVLLSKRKRGNVKNAAIAAFAGLCSSTRSLVYVCITGSSVRRRISP